MNEVIEAILQLRVLEVPRDLFTRKDVKFVFGEQVEEGGRSWLIPCTHVTSEPADEQDIDYAEQELGFAVPDQYKRFLRITNGAKLFCAEQKWLLADFPGSMHIRYNLFGCRELVAMNQQLLKTFRASYKDDPEYSETNGLNYVAFCDAADGNYQAMLLDQQVSKEVFFLFHELLYRPYSTLDSEFCYSISPSLESWFRLLLETGGWAGRGLQFGGL
jgi:hypothetical protein